MAVSASRLSFGKPHCEVCPLFLGQPVPVVQTERGIALFCEVCALGRGPMRVDASRAGGLEITVEDAGDAGLEEE